MPCENSTILPHLWTLVQAWWSVTTPPLVRDQSFPGVKPQTRVTVGVSAQVPHPLVPEHHRNHESLPQVSHPLVVLVVPSPE